MQSPKWLGRCGDCGAWNSFVEERAAAAPTAAAGANRYAQFGAAASAMLYAEVDNVRGRAMYETLGFSLARIDACYRVPIPGAGD